MKLVIVVVVSVTLSKSDAKTGHSSGVVMGLSPLQPPASVGLPALSRVHSRAQFNHEDQEPTSDDVTSPGAVQSMHRGSTKGRESMSSRPVRLAAVGVVQSGDGLAGNPILFKVPMRPQRQHFLPFCHHQI